MEALCATTPKEIDEGDFFKSRCKLDCSFGNLLRFRNKEWS